MMIDRSGLDDYPLYKDIHNMAEIAVGDLGPWISFVAGLEERSKTISATYDRDESCGSKWIFRGQADSAWPIASTFEREYLEWYSQFRDPERLLKEHELSMLERFRQKACGYVPRPEMSKVEWLALMRHYGVPTRFVDFTESPFVALYFASQVEDGCKEKSFAIWAVVRDNYNNYYAEKKDKEGRIFLDRVIRRYPKDQLNRVINDENSTDEDVLAYHRCTDPTAPNSLNLSQVMTTNREGAELVLSGDVAGSGSVRSKILTVYPQLPNSRMRAQSGLFLMPTQLSKPFMESLYEWSQLPKGKSAHKLAIEECVDKDMAFALSTQCNILKFVFPASLRKEVCAVLGMANVNAHTISPDLEGVADYVKKEFICKDRIVYRDTIKISIS